MNLNQVVTGPISAINPLQPATIQHSAGSTPNPDGGRTPTYDPAVTVFAQVQELTSRDLQQLEGLNIQGSIKAIYVNGFINGVVRVSQKGGDLITLQDGSIWLTTNVFEQWPDWVKVGVTLQNGS